MAEPRDALQAKMLKVLQSLTLEEQKLLRKVLQIEDENIHLERPRVAEEIVRQVRLVIS